MCKDLPRAAFVIVADHKPAQRRPEGCGESLLYVPLGAPSGLKAGGQSRSTCTDVATSLALSEDTAEQIAHLYFKKILSIFIKVRLLECVY